MKKNSTRLAHLFQAANVKIENSPPILIIFIFALITAVGYGVPLASFVAFSKLDGDSSAWAAFLLGFPALFLIPTTIEQALTTKEFLIVVFFTEGAVLGTLIGCIFLIIRPAEISPENNVDDNLK